MALLYTEATLVSKAYVNDMNQEATFVGRKYGIFSFET